MTRAVTIKNNINVAIRLLRSDDAEKLYHYLDSLSSESRSRFGPHPFDQNTIAEICRHPQNDTIRYIAENNECIIAYMLIQKGMIDADRKRYSEKNIFFDDDITATYAPSVADEFQSSGLGSSMFQLIENDLIAAGYSVIVLWGGVQASNSRAVHFYEKHLFRNMGSFWHDNKDNHDMIKNLNHSSFH